MRQKTGQNPKPMQNKCTVGPVSEAAKNRKNKLPNRITWAEVVDAGLAWLEKHLKDAPGAL